MNQRVYNALRKQADTPVVKVTEHDPSLRGAVKAVTTAPARIKGAMDEYLWENAPQYEKDYITKMQKLFGSDVSADGYLASAGKRGKAAIKILADMADKYRKDEKHDDAASTLNLLYNSAADIKKEHDTAGFNLGSAGSYGASMLGLGALGRLIAGKKHAGWGWGGGILAGALANYLRRKSYYGKGIMV